MVKFFETLRTFREKRTKKPFSSYVKDGEYSKRQTPYEFQESSLRIRTFLELGLETYEKEQRTAEEFI